MSDGINETRKGFTSYEDSDDHGILFYRIKLSSDPHNFVYISTNNPSTIFNTFGFENVICVEKLGKGYNLIC